MATPDSVIEFPGSDVGELEADLDEIGAKAVAAEGLR